jgi:hypothetical protein
LQIGEEPRAPWVGVSLIKCPGMLTGWRLQRHVAGLSLCFTGAVFLAPPLKTGTTEGNSNMKPVYLLSLVLLAGCTSVQTKIEINAPAATVRAILFKFDDYPGWNPFILKVDGTVEEGKEVGVTVKPVGKPEIAGRTTIISVQENRLSWRGSLAVPGIFRGEHEFIIEELDANRTMFQQNEKMSGLIIPFYDLKPIAGGFEAMNKSLKAKAEAAVK